MPEQLAREAVSWWQKTCTLISNKYSKTDDLKSIKFIIFWESQTMPQNLILWWFVWLTLLQFWPCLNFLLGYVSSELRFYHQRIDIWLWIGSSLHENKPLLNGDSPISQCCPIRNNASPEIKQAAHCVYSLSPTSLGNYPRPDCTHVSSPLCSK